MCNIDFHVSEIANTIKDYLYGIGISTEQTDSTTRYIYIDDCLYSENTVRQNLKSWIENAKRGSKLDVIFLASHSSGYAYTNQHLTTVCKDLGIEHKIWSEIMFKNSIHSNKYDCLWSTQNGSIDLSSFCSDLSQRAQENGWRLRFFRESNYQSTYYIDEISREIFEHALLKAGAYIYSCSENPNTSMKPMGYDYFNTLGFGSIFATFNNNANNCPLAFWWGDPQAQSGTLSKWYPLLPRRVSDYVDEEYAP